MGTDKEKATFEKSAQYIAKFMNMLDSVEDGMMKTHEFIGNVADHVNDVFVAAQDGIMDLSAALDEYREEVWQRMEEAEKKVYDDVNSPVAQSVKPNSSNTQDWVGPEPKTRDEKISYIVNYFGLQDNESVREGYKEYDDVQLDAIVKLVKRYNQS